jgi:cytochrome c peroxidase
MVSLVIRVGGDPGAAQGVPAMLADPLNVRGKFSDGYDGRLDALERVKPGDLLGAFRTPSLRCVEKRPSFTHSAQIRTLADVVAFLKPGGGATGPHGEKEIVAHKQNHHEEGDQVAFMRTLTGPGPAPELLTSPANP